MKVYLNNKFIDEEKATINIKDRGLLLGDSIFDTLLYNKNKIHYILQIGSNTMISGEHKDALINIFSE